MSAPVAYDPYYPWVRTQGGLYQNTVTLEVRYKPPSGPPPRRYLRMTQRDDGYGIERHPRLTGNGTNAPTSVQATSSPRIGTNNRYQ